MHSSCTACSLPFDRSKSTDFHRSCIVCYPVQYFRCCLESTYSSTAHHALIIWLSTQSQMDRWRIELHTVCIPTSVLCVINTRPLSDLMISALPFSLLSTIFTLNHFTLRFRFCVVHEETWRIRPSCLYIPRSVERWLINIAHSDILCDHVPDFNIDLRRTLSGV